MCGLYTETNWTPHINYWTPHINYWTLHIMRSFVGFENKGFAGIFKRL